MNDTLKKGKQHDGHTREGGRHSKAVDVESTLDHRDLVCSPPVTLSVLDCSLVHALTILGCNQRVFVRTYLLNNVAREHEVDYFAIVVVRVHFRQSSVLVL